MNYLYHVWLCGNDLKTAESHDAIFNFGAGCRAQKSLVDNDFVRKSGNAPAVPASGRFQFGKSVGRGRRD